ncbi:hypothetical protein J6590_024440 [Homalodisca vitripennis]|nr:hypothetical protein J6590_024440 [Homalodisca vitripennis]
MTLVHLDGERPVIAFSIFSKPCPTNCEHAQQDLNYGKEKLVALLLMTAGSTTLMVRSINTFTVSPVCETGGEFHVSEIGTTGVRLPPPRSVAVNRSFLSRDDSDDETVDDSDEDPNYVVSDNKLNQSESDDSFAVDEPQLEDEDDIHYSVENYLVQESEDDFFWRKDGSIWCRKEPPKQRRTPKHNILRGPLPG